LRKAKISGPCRCPRGKKVEMMYGATKKHDINEAYKWALQQNTLIARDNTDPRMHRIAERQAAAKAALKAKTFNQVAQEYYEERTDPRSSFKKPWEPDTAKGMRSIKDNLSKTDFGKLLVTNIESQTIADFINPYGQEAPAMALRYRTFINGVMDLARDQGCYQGPNPADPEGPLKRLLRIRHTSNQHPGWHHKEAPRLYTLPCEAEADQTHGGLLTTSQGAKVIGRPNGSTVRKWIADGDLPAKQLNRGKTSTYLFTLADLEKCAVKCGIPIIKPNAESSFGEAHLAIPLLRLIQLTAVRYTEAAQMLWAEINWPDKTWSIPVERTKTGRKHIVPLSDPAFEIIERMRARQDDPNIPYVFARGHTLTGIDCFYGRTLTGTCALKHLRDLTSDPFITIHSFRRNCRSWVEEKGFARLIGRAILGHAIGSALDYVYGGDAEYKELCREALNAWAAYLMGTPSKPPHSAEVIPLVRRTASA